MVPTAEMAYLRMERERGREEWRERERERERPVYMCVQTLYCVHLLYYTCTAKALPCKFKGGAPG